ncbi:MAG: hypothetical protein IT372_38230 [Polyangiaceae bacterium]|nr:hypothetical protein [Polyangiaceae bacterium]
MSKRSIAVISLLTGLVVGFFLGIASTKAGAAFLEDLASSEAPADVSEPIAVSRPGFSFRHPRNWKIDTADKDHDPDHLFSIESPGSCFTMMILFDGPTDPASNVQAQVDAYVPKVLQAPARIPFTQWGKYAGQGAELRGKMLGINPGAVRIFSHASEKKSFIAVEFCHDEDIKDVKPGFDLIASSFSLAP